ncbi:histone-lysine N-methyltransferase 2D-like, partial [Vombatus ursinus]
MDDPKPSGEDKDSETAADGPEASEESGPTEPDPPNPPLGDASVHSPGSPKPQDPPQDCSKGPFRRCAFCNCGEWSLHGQRELRCFELPPDWPLGPAVPSGGPGPGETAPPSDDLSQIGFPEGLTPAHLGKPGGPCWAHHWCAAWSVGVQGRDGLELHGVDKAVFSGISQRCSHCSRLGASIPCRSPGCPQLYHFPCAAASGSFQSMKTLQLLCLEHGEEAAHLEDARCVVCDGLGELRDLLFCTSCGQHYHGACLDTALTARKRAGWQCPDCKVCQTCRQPGEDSMMLVCEACDKGYHTFCLKPAIQSLPPDSWKCKTCRVCRACGACPAELDPNCQWYENYSLCERCQGQQNTQGGRMGSPDTEQNPPVCNKYPSPEPGIAPIGTPDDLDNACQEQLEGEEEASTKSEEPGLLQREAKPLGQAGTQVESPPEVPSPPEVAPLDEEMPLEPLFLPEEPLLSPQLPPTDPPPPPLSPATAVAPPSLSPLGEQEELPDAKGDSEPGTPPEVPILDTPISPPPEASCFEPEPIAPIDLTPSPASPEELGELNSPIPLEPPPPQCSPLPLAPSPLGFLEKAPEVLDESESQEMETEPECPALEPSGISPPACPTGDLSCPAPSPAPALDVFSSLGEDTVCLDETEATGPEPETGQTSGSSGSDPKGSPLLLDPEELAPVTPMEVYGSDGKQAGQSSPCEEPEEPVAPPVHTPPALIKSDIVNEISNLSQGDASASFPGSEPLLGSPDPEGGGSLSMELGVSTDVSPARDEGSLRLCTDSLPETDDSLLCDSGATGAGGKAEGDKGRRRSSPARSRIKQGRSSSFPGRRRPRGGAHGGRGRGRARLKSTTSSVETLVADIDSSPSKEEEEEDDDTMQNTVVLFSNTDKFVLMQDMCVVCGSFGRGAEGHLLACSQCSQCYHPYCVNSKITKVMLLKGWRCVECIVCEVCGQASDPSRLLLCDDCDISYHTYCLDPPLLTVPKGGWKCK